MIKLDKLKVLEEVYDKDIRPEGDVLVYREKQKSWKNLVKSWTVITIFVPS